MKIYERSFRPPQGQSSADFFLHIQNFIFDLASKNIRENVEDYIKKSILDKVKDIKNMKLNELTNPNSKEKNNLHDFMIYNVEEEEISKKQDIYFIEKDGKEDKIMNDVEDFNTINNKYDSLLNFKAKYPLLDPKEVLSIENSDIIKTYMGSFKLDTEEFKLIENPYDAKALDEKIENSNIEYGDDLLNNFPHDSNFVRYLIVTHSGVIREIINIVSRINGLSYSSSKSYASNCSITILRIYCSHCKGKCLSKSENCDVKFELKLADYNDYLEKVVNLQ